MNSVKGYFISQNLSMFERMMRFVLGVVMIGVPYALLTQTGGIVNDVLSWSMVLSTYPFITSIIGLDPLYRLFKIKTCDVSDRNRCGSFPFQVDAFVGRHPMPEDDMEHTLLHSKHSKHLKDA